MAPSGRELSVKQTEGEIPLHKRAISTYSTKYVLSLYHEQADASPPSTQKKNHPSAGGLFVIGGDIY